MYVNVGVTVEVSSTASLGRVIGSIVEDVVDGLWWGIPIV
jgi:hypothetical protein